MGYYGFYDTMGMYSFKPIVCLVAALAAALLGAVLYFTFLQKKNEGRFTGFKARVYNFLNVNKFYAEDIIKLLYVMTACVLTAVGIVLIVMGSFLAGILAAIVGNVAARITYECILMFFVLVRKTVAVDRRLAGIEKFYTDDFDDMQCDDCDTECEDCCGAEAEVCCGSETDECDCSDCSDCSERSGCAECVDRGCEADNI